MASSSVGLEGPTPWSLDPATESRRWLRPLLVLEAWLARLDSAVVVAALIGSALLATAAFLLRNLGLPSSAWFEVLPRYLTVAIGFVGAALATRAGGHIALDLSSRFLAPKVARWTRFTAEWVAFGVATYLAIASWDFIEVERSGGSLLLGTVPSWWPAVVLLWGFGAAALRFLLRIARIAPWALVAAPLTVWGLSHVAGAAPDAVFWLAGSALLAGALLGMPLFAILGGAALLLFWNDGAELAAVPVEVYRLSEAPTLVTLPLFTMMGAVLAAGKAPQRLVQVARAWLGWAPGGLAVATVVVCAFFTTFTGASGVTILALGLLLYELLRQEGYPDRLSLGLVTASGSIGLLFAPALPLIIYGIVAKVDINEMFVAGLLPGVVLTVMVGTAAVLMARRSGKLERRPFVWREAVHSVRVAVWELLLPVLVLGLLLSGLATVVEAAAVGSLYTLVIAAFVHKDVPLLREMPRIVRDSGVLIGAVLIILGVALAFTGYLVDAEVPQAVVAFAKSHLASPWTFLLSVNLLLLVVGCLLDIFSAIIIFVPLLTPVAAAFGVNPVHLGIVFLANLEIGYLTPPVGMNLFLSSFRFGRPLPEIWRTALPFLLVMLLALLVITYVPALSLGLLSR